MHRAFQIIFVFWIVCVAQLPASAQFQTNQTAEENAAQAKPAPSVESVVELLTSIIADEARRTELIELLGTLAESKENAGPAEQTSTPEASEEEQKPTFARQIADLTKSGVETAYGSVASIWRDFAGIRALFSDLSEQRRQRISTNAFPLLGTIAATTILLWVLTAMFGRLSRRRFGSYVPETIWQTVITVASNAVLDVVSLAIAYAAGFALAISVFGGGQIAVEQSLYLNAFLVAGIARIFVRVFVLPDRPDQAIFNFSAAVQTRIYRWLIPIAGLLVYGITAAVPIANIWVSFLAGQSIRNVIVTIAAIIALVAIRNIANTLRAEQYALGHRLNAEAPTMENAHVESEDVMGDDAREAKLSVWYRLWPWLASAYVVFAYLIAIAQPSLMIDLVGAATLKTIVAGGIVALSFRFMQRAATAGAPVPKAVLRALPELKTRLDGFVPLALRLFSLALLAVAAGFLIDAWHVIDVGGLLASPTGSDLVWRLISALLIVAIILLVWAVISSWIDYRLTLDLEGRNVSARSRTLLSLFRNAFTVAVVVFGAMITLSQLGIDIAPLLAGAGVIGLAIGFGSQKLVQDIITGVFIQLENAINEGDVVTVGGVTGSVEKLTIRSVGLRDANGTYHIVPFSSVDMVSNFMRKFAYHVAVVGVAYKESIPKVKAAMEEAFQRLKATEHGSSIIGDLEMHGVIELADSSVNVRARIKTRPGKQWAVGRQYTEIVKEVFDEQGIEIPFPHRQMVLASEPDASRLVPAAENASKPHQN